jgi:hypothetical protein
VDEPERADREVFAEQKKALGVRRADLTHRQRSDERAVLSPFTDLKVALEPL